MLELEDIYELVQLYVDVCRVDTRFVQYPRLREGRGSIVTYVQYVKKKKKKKMPTTIAEGPQPARPASHQKRNLHHHHSEDLPPPHKQTEEPANGTNTNQTKPNQTKPKASTHINIMDGTHTAEQSLPPGFRSDSPRHSRRRPTSGAHTAENMQQARSQGSSEHARRESGSELVVSALDPCGSYSFTPE
jgi:hypothetical protein